MTVPQPARISNHCLIDRPTHLRAFRYRHPVVAALLRALYALDPKMHFTGPLGFAWRLLDVTRSSKNPNLCTL